ncbi:Serine/threonine-protein kinase fray2, partial [Mucuna pruriens]
ATVHDIKAFNLTRQGHIESYYTGWCGSPGGQLQHRGLETTPELQSHMITSQRKRMKEKDQDKSVVKIHGKGNAMERSETSIHDIWSFGITALELAHGHAPFSKYPPMKVLLKTLQNASPGLDYERDKRFSKSFKELVATCLVKDPKKRPSSEKLLKHHFFKQARGIKYLAHTILDGLAPLGDGFRMLKKEYIRGISAWNFNPEDLKSQATLIQDDDIPNAEEPHRDKKQKDRLDDFKVPGEELPVVAANHSDGAPMPDKEEPVPTLLNNVYLVV